MALFDDYTIPEAFAYICENFGCPVPESYLIYNLYYNKTDPTEPDKVVFDYSSQIIANVLEPFRTTNILQTSKYPDRLRNLFYLPYDNNSSLNSIHHWA